MTNSNIQQRKTLSEALRWVTNGVAVIPCHPKSKISVFKWKKYQDELPSAADLQAWWEGTTLLTGKVFNIAVVTGKGLTVIDFDDKYLYVEWLEYIYQSDQQLVETYQVRTGKGIHIYYRLERPTRNLRLSIPKINSLSSEKGYIDVKGEGGYVLAPPSIHPSGETYEIIKDLPIMRIRSIDQVLPSGWLPETRPDLKTVREFSPARQRPNEQPKPKRIKPRPATVTDPWASADNPGQVEDVITRIKNRFDIMDYFPDAQPSGSGFYKARCPFHDDHNPSFWIDDTKQICGCYSGCTPQVLDVINFYGKLNNLSNEMAIREMKKML